MEGSTLLVIIDAELIQADTVFGGEGGVDILENLLIVKVMGRFWTLMRPVCVETWLVLSWIPGSVVLISLHQVEIPGIFNEVHCPFNAILFRCRVSR